MKQVLSKYYVGVFKKYAIFGGRARRKEYWMFFLFNIFVGFVLGLIEGLLNMFPETTNSILGNIYNVGVIIPSLAVGVRRMHDTDHNGWWIICPFVNFVFLIINGNVGPNKYGSDPKVVSE